MASTARSDDETKEYFDSPEDLEKKVTQLAEWIKESKHMIVFTVSSGPRLAGKRSLRMHCDLLPCIDASSHISVCT